MDGCSERSAERVREGNSPVRAVVQTYYCGPTGMSETVAEFDLGTVAGVVKLVSLLDANRLERTEWQGESLVMYFTGFFVCLVGGADGR